MIPRRTHTVETRQGISAALAGRVPTAEARAKMRAAKLGTTRSAEAWQKRRGFRQFMSDEEAEDYRLLRRYGYGRDAALTAIGRGDLLGAAR